MMSVLAWYVAMQVFALTALPLAFRVCTRLHDRGYAISKGLGLLLVSYATWLLLFLPGATDFWPFGFRTVAIGWAFVAVASASTLAFSWQELFGFLRTRIRYILTCECIFISAFALMILFRATVPHISYHISEPTTHSFNDLAAEKFTDFAVLNSLLTSESFPPHDAWLAPTPDTTRDNGALTGGWLNYYYFGHFMWAVLIKSTLVRPEVGFNLALAGLFSLVCLLSFNLGYNLTRRIRWGLLSMFLIALASNIDGFLQLVAIAKTRLVDATQDAWYITGPWYRTYDFWRSSRAVENTITEFPAFSFVLGDLHAHVSALVILLVGLTFAIQVTRNVADYRSIFTYQIHNLDELFFCALIAGALSAANSWDAITFGGIIVVALWSGSRPRVPRYAYEEPWRLPLRSLTSMAASLVIGAIVVLFGMIVLFLMFWRYFQSPLPRWPSWEAIQTVYGDNLIASARDILFAGPIKLVAHSNRTDPFEFLSHWLLLGLPSALLLIALLRRQLRRGGLTSLRKSAWPETLAWITLAVAIACVLRPIIGGWTPIILLMTSFALLAALISHRQPPAVRMWLGLLLIFALLTCFCEFFYFDDIFTKDIERINTVFKIYYGLWPAMAVAAVIALRRLIRMAPPALRTRRTWLLATPLVLCGAVYPLVGPVQRVSHSTRLGHWNPPEGISPEEAPTEMQQPSAQAKSIEHSLDGLRYLEYLHPDDRKLIDWIRATLPGHARILEAAGTQYTYSGRIGTLTGRLSFAGWLYHCWGWRGDDFEAERVRRLQIAQAIYEAIDPREAYDMLLENGIEYVVVGEQERKQYVDIAEDKFAELGRRVFRSNDTVVYEIDYTADPPPRTDSDSEDSSVVTSPEDDDESSTSTQDEETWEPSDTRSEMPNEETGDETNAPQAEPQDSDESSTEPVAE